MTPRGKGSGKGLGEYERKRDFDSTPEPTAKSGRRKKAGAPRFVVQEHSARRLHWDLRLEHDGVAASWAVPNGIPLDPAENRKAVHTEDHPLSYLEFEGEIPAGEYGAGVMRIWDRGTYEVEKWEEGKGGLEDDLARLAARVLGGGAVGVEDLRHRFGIGQGPEPVALAPRHRRGLGTEGGDVDRRPPVLGKGVDDGAVGGEVVARAAQLLAVPERPDHLQRLLHALDLLADRGPAVAERRLIQRLAGAEAEVGPARIHHLERRPGLGDQRRVVARAGGSDPGAEEDPLGRLRGGAEPDPGVAGLAALPPGLEVVAAADPVKAGPLGGDRLAQQVVGRELLVGAKMEVAHAAHLPGWVAGKPGYLHAVSSDDPTTVVVLDIDGTLVDTNYQHALAWHRALCAHDHAVQLWQIHRHIGMGGDQIVAALLGEEAERSDGDAIRAEEGEAYGELIGEVQAMKGATELLRELREDGAKTILASTCWTPATWSRAGRPPPTSSAPSPIPTSSTRRWRRSAAMGPR
jgi:DNA ligase D-like protein (predicted 3'-phosphoesterase)